MVFTTTAEIAVRATPNYVLVTRASTDIIAAELEKTSSLPTDLTLIYAPIVMPSELLEKYTARKRFDRKVKTLSYSPQLNFNIFAFGEKFAALDEYFEGLKSARSELMRIGFSKEQTDAFDQAIDIAAERARKRLMH
jgi:hypothetical protein